MDLEQIVQRMESLSIQLDRIESKLSKYSDTMDMSQASQYLSISKSKLEKITSPKNLLISVSKIGGKKVFHKKDLDKYLATTKHAAL